MIEHVRELLLRYRRLGIIIDTNILLLYFLGRFAPEQIERFKRTKDRFVSEDFTVLKLLLTGFDRIVTTPTILAEVSSFSNQLSEPLRTKYFENLRTELTLIHENYVESGVLARRSVFVKFGLTDASILLSAQGAYLVLTDDFSLTQYLQSQNVDVINFNNIRTLGWT